MNEDKHNHNDLMLEMNNQKINAVSIKYCTKCKWLLRASWISQELLSTFEQELSSVTLQPGTNSGIFEIIVNDQLIWSRHQQNGFPEIKHLKQLVRDIIAPERHLGHIDKHKLSID
jgi:selenoprotein W-related protein